MATRNLDLSGNPYGARSAEPRAAIGLGYRISELLFSSGIITLLIYAVGFNFMPLWLVDALSVAYPLLLYGACVPFILFHVHRLTVPAMAFLALIPIVAIPIVFGFPDIIPIEAPRTFLGLACLAFLSGQLQFRKRTTLEILYIALVAASLAVFAIGVMGPAVFLRTYRLATIFGEVGSVHPSAYLCASLLLCMLAMMRRRVGSQLLNICLVGMLLYLVVGYQVRTVWVMLLSAFLYAIYRQVLDRIDARRLVQALLAILGFLGMLGLFNFAMHADHLYEFGSGRIGAYVYRAQIISNRSTLEQMFGSGPGTDRFRGEYTWKSSAKDSHNDYLSTLIEQGFIGLALVLILVASSFFVERSVFRRGVIVALLMSSAVSNGALFRPSNAPPFILAIMLWPSTAAAPDRRKRQLVQIRR